MIGIPVCAFCDLGRDELVAAANGTTTYKDVTYTTTVEYVTGLLPPGSAGALSLLRRAME